MRTRFQEKQARVVAGLSLCAILTGISTHFLRESVFAQTQPAAVTKKDPANDPPVDFPLGTATPSEACGVCHGAIYFEHAFGLGADLNFKPIIYKSLDEGVLTIPPNFSTTGTAHHLAGVDPWPIRARQVENGGQSCNTCHFPQAFEIP